MQATKTTKTTKAAKKAAVTSRQQNVLDVITKMQSNTKGAATQEAMASKLGITQHTFSEHIARLEKKDALRVYRNNSRIKFYEIV